VRKSNGRKHLRALIPAAALLLAACGEPEPGVVEGDVFLAEDVGREVNLAGARVRLVRDLGRKAELDSLLARRACPTRAGAVPGAGAQERAWRERGRLLDSLAVASATADARARFRVGAAPGRYRLWTDTTVRGERWTWLQPVIVRAGETARVNLSNANPDENPFRCP
jgi:hypothetical protein